MKYGQFCPIAKSLELIGERWSILILREILMGGRRFGDIERGLGGISSSLLAKRLRDLEASELIQKITKPGLGPRYVPTRAALELQPVLMALGNWGMSWTRENLVADDYDVELLMLYLERSVDLDHLPLPIVVVRFEFQDLQDHRFWWLVAQENQVEICTSDPGYDVDIYVVTTLQVMTRVWLGHDSYDRAVADGSLTLLGDGALTRNLRTWIRNSEFEKPALS